MEEAIPEVAPIMETDFDYAAYGAPGAEFWAMSATMSAIFIILIIWSLVWKGLALWRAARNGHTAWYIVLLLLNTVGILEILYYFIWGKPKTEKHTPPTPPQQ